MAGPSRPTGGRLVLLCTDCDASRIVYHRLGSHFPDVVVVVEDPVPRTRLLWRRLRRLGAATVLGQALFLALVVPVLRRTGRARIEEIKREFSLDDGPFHAVHRVPSVNDQSARAVVERLQPAVVVVCGTRIISAETLRTFTAPVVNYHAGITPAYRGYWALAEGRPDLAGSTVHLVDAGIDTGGILAQRTIAVTPRDSFATYPYLHVAAALPAIVSVAGRALAGEPLAVQAPVADLPSKLRSHPTAWTWARHALRGVR
jgi:hypothetical protein